MSQNIVAIAIAVAVVAGGLGFYGGMKYQQSRRSAAFSQFGQGRIGTQNGTGTRTGTRNGFRPVSGEILKADDAGITVKLSDGSSKIVLITEKTAIKKAESATRSDLSVGTTVAVFGSENSDGSVTAQDIQLNPTRMGMPEASPSPAN